MKITRLGVGGGGGLPLPSIAVPFLPSNIAQKGRILNKKGGGAMGLMSTVHSK